MKILHVAVFTSRSTNTWQAKAFEKLGHEVIRFDYRAVARQYGLPKRDRSLVELCQSERPDITLFSKCNIMDVKVLKKCRKTSTVVLWIMDGIAFYPKRDDELIDKMKNSDYVFASVPCQIDEAKKWCSNVYKLYGGYDSDEHFPINTPKIRDVAFIGGVHRYVRPYREYLWKNVGFEVIGGVWGKDHSKVVSETKINLNLTDGYGVSNRLFKLLASKGFVLSNAWRGMEDEFTPNKDFAMFDTAENLKSQIAYYLVHKKEREKIAAHGHATVKKYDNFNYARTIIEKVCR